MKDTCTWYRGMSFGFRSYKTECGGTINIYDNKETPKECPYCDREVEVEE